ncbi:MAG: VCBS repeat-containing protein [Pyrinomonadaceae bacterium]
MKRNIKGSWRAVLALCLVAAFAVAGFGQKVRSDKTSVETTKSTNLGGGSTLLTEDFDLTAGALLTDNGWTAHSAAGTNALTVASPGLTFSGYPGSGVGNAVPMTVSGEDAHHTFATQTAGTVYAAFMVNISEAANDPVGGYFAHFGPDPISTTFRGRIFALKDGSNNLAFGISKASTSTTTNTGFDYSLGTTYVLVVKYTINDTGDDTVDLFVLTSIPGTEPAPTASAPDTTATDINPGSFALRQGSSATAPTATFDGLRVGTTWASVTQGATAPTQNYLDFDGNGLTDFVVTRTVPSLGFTQRRWFVNHNGVGTTEAYDWGLISDEHVPADYDGDGKTDIAVFRRLTSGEASGNGFFYILESAGFTLRQVDFGQAGDDATVVGDYDGDGKADVAVYRPGASSTWYYLGSDNNAGGSITFVPWGQTGDFVAPGDYDGDGKADFVVQRDGGGGTANFWMNLTTDGISTVSFGRPTDFITPGDFDGDGKTDIAIARPNGGAIEWWHRRSSDSNVAGATFGVSATDSVTVGDYDGDGKSDLAIWRPSANAGESAFWYFGSTSGAAAVPFGQTGDFPVAAYNLH